ncbi:type II secretion system F family protein [Alkalibacillus haloalkaliphilus]|uniref:Type II secretion system protein n=1 Tax=Alkalibacillus haloalkaliphilus TaxID=94136 RepID=A0A511VZZ3_9BACI|nr:type II secretion system F family protein [Alkalibacillus haloalkaliphilus]GEN44400.1 type II secretion system protein [Alkalibacillus haloalkaliphilus]
MEVLLFVLTMTLFTLGVVLYSKERKEKYSRRRAWVIDEGAQEEGEKTAKEKAPSLYQRLLAPKLKQFRKSFRRNISSAKEEEMELKLLRAGSPFGMSPFEYRLVQLILVALFPLLAIGLSIVGNVSFGRSLFMIILALVFAVYLPYAYLKWKTAVRSDRAIKELPDFIDLLAVSMEAGLGFDSALSKVISKQEGVLANEFRRCLEELKLGKTRKEALAGVRDRLEADDIKLLVGSVIQAEQLGVGMVQILRVQSEEVRQRRKQRAEEAAMKAPIKMMFPLVLFIFPTIFIVLLGPAVIQILEVF